MLNQTAEPRRIDWQKAMTRLAESQRALHEALTVSPEEAAEIYHRRAVLLAKAAKPLPAGIFPAMVFTLSGDHYAIPLKDLTGVARLSHCTPIPGSPEFVMGVMTIRGQLRPVVDLSRLLLGLEARSEVSSVVMLLRNEGMEIAVRVDSVEGVQNLTQPETPKRIGKHTLSAQSGAPPLVDTESVLERIFAAAGQQWRGNVDSRAN